jgi:hypothetical protein
MIFQRFVLKYLSIDFSTHTRTPPQGWPKSNFDTPVGEYGCESKNRWRDISKQTFEISSGASINLVLIQKTEIFGGRENGLNATCPLYHFFLFENS